MGDLTKTPHRERKENGSVAVEDGCDGPGKIAGGLPAWKSWDCTRGHRFRPRDLKCPVSSSIAACPRCLPRPQPAPCRQRHAARELRSRAARNSNSWWPKSNRASCRSTSCSAATSAAPSCSSSAATSSQAVEDQIKVLDAGSLKRGPANERSPMPCAGMPATPCRVERSAARARRAGAVATGSASTRPCCSATRCATRCSAAASGCVRCWCYAAGEAVRRPRRGRAARAPARSN